MKKILFVCVGNAFRSRIAEEIFNSRAPDGFVAESAGMNIIDHVCENVQNSMREIGIEMNLRKPRRFRADMAKDADRVIVFRDAITVDLNNIRFACWDVKNCGVDDLDCIRNGRDEIVKLVDDLIRILK